MARFYVGQRVRIKWSMCYPEFIGRETRIAGPLEEWINGISGLPYFGYPLSIHPEFAAKPENLEPIQDPGHQVISWEEMADLWTPEKVSA